MKKPIAFNYEKYLQALADLKEFTACKTCKWHLNLYGTERCKECIKDDNLVGWEWNKEDD